MIVKERLNPEIWEFWIRTHKAWLSGALSSFDPLPQEIAKNTLVIERFADDSPKVTAAIRKLIPRPDEFLVSYSPDDCDVLLTNQRLMVRTHQDVRYEIIELSEIVTYTETGFFNKTVNLSLHNGLVRRFTKLKGAIKEECMRFALTNCPKKEVLQAPEPVSISRTKNLRTSPLSPVLREWYFEKTIQQGVESMSEKDGDMIGSEYPELQKLIKTRMITGEELLAFATATTLPTGNLYWIPVVGSLLELGRVAGLKPYVLAVTNKRFLIIQHNRFSKATKELREVKFEDVPISLVHKCVAQGRFLDGIYAKDSFKLDLSDGRKYHFRGITKESATVLRDAILRIQNGRE